MSATRERSRSSMFGVALLVGLTMLFFVLRNAD